MVWQERMLSQWRNWCLVIKVIPWTGKTKKNGAISSKWCLYTKVVIHYVLAFTCRKLVHVMRDAYKYTIYISLYFYSTCKGSFRFTITCLPYKFRNTCLYEKEYIHFFLVCILSSRINNAIHFKLTVEWIENIWFKTNTFNLLPPNILVKF